MRCHLRSKHHTPKACIMRKVRTMFRKEHIIQNKREADSFPYTGTRFSPPLCSNVIISFIQISSLRILPQSFASQNPAPSGREPLKRVFCLTAVNNVRTKLSAREPIAFLRAKGLGCGGISQRQKPLLLYKKHRAGKPARYFIQ